MHVSSILKTDGNHTWCQVKRTCWMTHFWLVYLCLDLKKYMDTDFQPVISYMYSTKEWLKDQSEQFCFTGIQNNFKIAKNCALIKAVII